jgi:hypothetical protein
MFAGGGIKKGLTYGATDDLGYAAVENPVSVHDCHATSSWFTLDLLICLRSTKCEESGPPP